MTMWIDADDTILDLNTRIINYFNNECYTEIKDRYPDGVQKEHIKTFNVLHISNKIMHLFESADMYHKNNEILVKPVEDAYEFFVIINNICKKYGVEYKILTHSMSDDAANSKDYILDKHFGISKDKIVHAKDKENHVQVNDIIIDDATHNHKAILEKYNIKNRNNLNFMPKQPWNNKLKSIFRGDILEIANKIKENFENNIYKIEI